MANQPFVEPYQIFTSDGSAVANSTSAGNLYQAVSFTGYYMSVGRRLRGEMSGKLSTTGTPTVIFTIKWGSTTIAVSEAITMGSAVTNVNWWLNFRIQTRADGASGKLLCAGKVVVQTNASGDPTVKTNVFGVSGSDAPAEVTVDLTTAADLTVTATWSAASASNTITPMEYAIESIN